jgi:LPXTG-motif cell wall-anchored protein
MRLSLFRTDIAESRLAARRCPLSRVLIAAALVASGVAVVGPAASTTSATDYNCGGTAGAGFSLTEDGKDVVTNSAQLAALTADSSYIQRCDIDLQGIAWAGATGSTAFTGTYDGGGKTISNVSISATAPKWGLFRETDGASITNLTLNGVNFHSQSTHDYNGALIGYAVNTSVSAVTVNDLVLTGGDDYVGGLIGYLGITSGSSSITTVSVQAHMSAGPDDEVGGVIGLLAVTGGKITITDVSSQADITAKDDYVGVLIGRVNALVGSSVTIARISGSGSIIGDDETGGLFGYLNAANGGEISVSEALANVTVHAAGGYGVGGLVGQADVGNGSTLIVDSVTALGQVKGSLRTGGLIGEINLEANSTLEIQEAVASGSVSGQDYVGGLIGELVTEEDAAQVTVSASSASGDVTGSAQVGGLIGRLFDGYAGSITVFNVSASGDVIGGGSYVGGLIGKARSEGDLKLTDAYATGDVNGDQSNSDYVGGLIGYARADGSASTLEVSNVWASGRVTGDDELGGVFGHVRSNADGAVTVSAAHASGEIFTVGYNVGGLIGNAYSSGGYLLIEKSFAIGPVYGDDETGGLIGYAQSSGDFVLRQSFATGLVSNSAATGSEEFGGLIGQIDVSSTGTMTVEDVYAKGDVSTHPNDETGGLVGEILVGSTATLSVARSFAVGEVASVGTDIGGLIGRAPTGFTATSSYWDVSTTKQDESAGVASNSGKTTSEMTSIGTFDGWDISIAGAGSTIWGICEDANDGYPFLMWQTELVAGSPGKASCSPGAETTDPGTGVTTDVPDPVTPVTPTEPEVASPAPVQVNGGLPQMTPGEVVVYEDGVPVSVQVFVDDDTELVIEASTFELRLAGECESGCTVAETDEGRYVLTLEEDGAARTEGSGFQPGSQVDVWLFSTPTYLGQLTVNADGSFSGLMDLGDIEVGEHTLQVNGLSLSGSQRSANMGVLVNSVDDAVPTTLPATGTDVMVFPWVVLMLAAGGLLVLTSRRTRRI